MPINMHFLNKDEGEIEVSLKKENSEWVLRVKDNGKGFEEDPASFSSYGIETIYGLSKQLKGQIRFFNHNGAVVEFRTKTKMV